MPFKIKVTWLDGLESIELTDVQLNVPVDAARFGKPAPPAVSNETQKRRERRGSVRADPL